MDATGHIQAAIDLLEEKQEEGYEHTITLDKLRKAVKSLEHLLTPEGGYNIEVGASSRYATTTGGPSSVLGIGALKTSQKAT